MKFTRNSVYYGLSLGAIFYTSYSVVSFLVNDSTEFDLQPVDWDGIGAFMSGIGALATVAAAWAATETSRAALELSREAADTARHSRNRRALTAMLQIQNELDIVVSRLDAALKLISEDRSIDAFQRSISQMRKTRINVVDRCVSEAEIFEPLFAVQLSIVSSADRKLKEIFGSTEEDGHVTHVEAIDLYCSLVSNYRDTAKVARDEARKTFGWSEFPSSPTSN